MVYYREFIFKSIFINFIYLFSELEMYFYSIKFKRYIFIWNIRILNLFL